MEYSWGRNIGEMGFGDLGATLASRWFSDGVYTYWLTNAVISSGQPIVCYLQNTGAVAIGLTQGPPTMGQHFPYGLPVDPNVPV